MIADANRFMSLCAEATGSDHVREGIGTLSEKTLHRILKKYIEPDESFHEVKVGRRVADVRKGNNISEIQTRAFNLLRPKLSAFLKEYEVTIVFPIAFTKRICWMDPERKEIISQRKSPKKGSPFDIFAELYKIKMYLGDPNLKFRIIMLGINEYRLHDPLRSGKKKRVTKYESIPNAIFDEIEISGVKDFLKLLPENMPEEFGTKELSKLSLRSEYRARTALNVLHSIGAIVRIPSDTRAYKYKINPELI